MQGAAGEGAYYLFPRKLNKLVIRIGESRYKELDTDFGILNYA